MFNLAGSFGVSLGAAGVGVGPDVTIIDKDTPLYIGSGAQVNSGGDIAEDLLSVVANAGASETAGVAASVSVQAEDADGTYTTGTSVTVEPALAPPRCSSSTGIRRRTISSSIFL